MAIKDNTAVEIPVINIQALTKAGARDPKALEQLGEELLRKANYNGFVAITGHGIPQERLTKAFASSKALFDLPNEEKDKVPRQNGGARRGYSAIGREHVASKFLNTETDPAKREALAKITDYKETFEFGSEDNPDQSNVWIPDDKLPGFREFEQSFFKDVHGLAVVVRELLISSVKLTPAEADRVREIHTDKGAHMRLAHYPPKPDGAENNDDTFSRIGPHTDYSMFTFVFQNGIGGLEFMDRASGRYIPASPIEGAVYMNIGDMFEILSNGIYTAAPHRVVGQAGTPNQSNRSGVSAKTDRHSIIYFAFTRFDNIIEPLPSLVTEERKKFCEPIAFKDFADRVNQKTFLG